MSISSPGPCVGDHVQLLINKHVSFMCGRNHVCGWHLSAIRIPYGTLLHNTTPVCCPQSARVARLHVAVPVGKTVVGSVRHAPTRGVRGSCGARGARAEPHVDGTGRTSPWVRPRRLHHILTSSRRRIAPPRRGCDHGVMSSRVSAAPRV